MLWKSVLGEKFQREGSCSQLIGKCSFLSYKCSLELDEVGNNHVSRIEFMTSH